jgi:membrane carboxypeptidase/penicillin-binding protein
VADRADLPDVQVLRDVRTAGAAVRVLADGKLIALFGETRRYPVAVAEIPDQVKQAVIAIEDARFYEHPGIDWRGHRARRLAAGHHRATSACPAAAPSPSRWPASSS